MENKHTAAELRQMQALPLDLKIRMTENRIKAWVNKYGVEGVYVSFSGGKDSTILLDIARRLYPDVEAVFVDTGLEFPEIREFVRGFENVTWLRPKMTFKQVIDKYGYPFIGKEIAHKIYSARRYQKYVINGEQTDSRYKGCKNYYLQLKGELKKTDGGKSKFSYPRYEFMLDAPFEVKETCCDAMKKSPAKEYEKKSGKHPMTAQMACESRLRVTKWIQQGCNMFDIQRPLSNPMAFWLEQDVLLYIKIKHLQICSIYGEVITKDGEAVTDETIDFIKACNTPLKTTGCDRTGCMFCGFGCHLDKKGEGRFLRMKETHPKQYAYIMKPKEEGGLGYKKVIDWINEHGNMHIEY